MRKTLQYITIGLIFLVSCQSKTGFSGFQNGDNIPKEELVISPASMFKSDQLITVFEN